MADTEKADLMATPFVIGMLDHARGEGFGECPYSEWLPYSEWQWQEGWKFSEGKGVGNEQTYER